MNNKNLMIIIIVLLVIIIGYIGYNEYQKIAKRNPINYYLSFVGEYSFQIPDDYIVDDITIPNAQMISKKDEKIQVENINEIYNKGVVAVQSFEAQLPDEESFKNYINNYKDSLAKSLAGEGTVDYSKANEFTVAIIKVNAKGKLIRTQYIYNSKQPVTVVAQEANDAYTTIIDSLDSAEKRAGDYQTIQRDIVSNIFMIKNKMFNDVYRLSSKSLKDKISLENFQQSLEKVSTALQTSTSVSGGVISSKKNEFTAVLLFSNSSDERNLLPQNAIGNIVLKKESSTWKLAGISLPSNEAFNINAQ